MFFLRIENRLGLRNVVTSDEEWPTVGWETIARADPSVLVIARMDRRRFPADDVEAKLRFLKSDPVTSRTPLGCLATKRSNRSSLMSAIRTSERSARVRGGFRSSSIPQLANSSDRSRSATR